MESKYFCTKRVKPIALPWHDCEHCRKIGTSGYTDIAVCQKANLIPIEQVRKNLFKVRQEEKPVEHKQKKENKICSYLKKLSVLFNRPGKIIVF